MLFEHNEPDAMVSPLVDQMAARASVKIFIEFFKTLVGLRRDEEVRR